MSVDWLALVEHLAAVWSKIRWEEGFPLGLTPRSARTLWADVERLLGDADGGTNGAKEVLAAFRFAHNLASALPDVPPVKSLWLVRQGNLCLVAGPNSADAEVRVEAAFSTLTTLADEILSLARPGERRDLARARWENRENASYRDRLKLFTGLADDALDELQGSGSLEAVWEAPGDAFQPTEIMAAARASAILSVEVQSQLLEKVRAAGLRPSTELNAWSATAKVAVRRALEPWRQGYLAARAVRGHHAPHPTDPLDIEHILRERLNVEVAEFAIPSRQVDAFAVWGPRHGPLVLWNPLGLFSSDPEGRMATLAHELGHLLIDRDGALPLMELLRGKTPEKHEQRARAFAAELLLPQAVAGPRFDGVDLQEARREFTTLQKHYHVSAELAAWQIVNSRANITPTVRRFLRSWVTNPDAFDRAAASIDAFATMQQVVERFEREQDEGDAEFARVVGRRAMRLGEW
ncbi:MAG TPA: ImmA/IrrE family metallo-endopeptidase [Thermoleophilia bacterium]|nr:ImmA/IrrE family metallo-endopeptidase [Thermoleophilia bacterium]